MNAMALRKKAARREAVVNVRMPTPVRDLIDEAADLLGQSRSAFIIDSSRKSAVDVLLDKRLFTLDSSQYDAFVTALEEPPQPNEKLKRLLASKSPWEK